MTDAEKNAAWDKQFYESLGEFDKRLSKEQAEIEKQRTATAGNGRSSGGSSSDGGGAGSEGASGIPQEVAGGQTGSTGENSAAPSGGAGQPGNSGPKYPAPEGTPTGVDDDVVARQLREAAESEKDPALRERLWQEYRKYKSRK